MKLETKVLISVFFGGIGMIALAIYLSGNWQMWYYNQAYFQPLLSFEHTFEENYLLIIGVTMIFSSIIWKSKFVQGGG